jgi:hypothetical protein
VADKKSEKLELLTEDSELGERFRKIVGGRGWGAGDELISGSKNRLGSLL